MKLRILSDLHIDFEKCEIKKNEEDYLILAGDISNNKNKTLELITNYLKDEDAKVILVLGNHDFYGSNIEETIYYWTNLKVKNLYVLQDQSIVIEDIRFYGCTLWTDYNERDAKIMYIGECTMVDFSQIKYFTAEKSVKYHKESKEKMIKEVEGSDEKVVIITHHLPLMESIVPKYKNNIIKYAFACTDMEEVFNEKIILWIHGHTHSGIDYYHKTTRVFCNPKGYKNENKEFDINKIIII